VGDGKLLWKSNTVVKSGVSQSFNIDITGVQTLELFVDCPGPANWAHAVWVEPQVRQ
jgi:hypothetical protein